MKVMVECFVIYVGGVPIVIEQCEDNRALFRVTYWKQVKDNLTYEQAAHNFGECVFHALACNGQLNNEGKE